MVVSLGCLPTRTTPKTSALTAGVTLRVPTGHSSANHAMKPTVSYRARMSISVFDGKDIYDLVVDWNRKFIAENPDHLLPHVHCWTKDGALVRTTYRLKDFPWYPVVADLSIPFEDLHDALIAHLKKELGDKFSPYRTEIRNIGIDIACYDEDNASLPYPIKITSKKTGICYEELPPSKWDPEQGLCEYRPRYV